MDYEHIAYLHLATVVPAFVLGLFLLGGRKGSPRHRAAGRVYLVCIAATCVLTLLMPARVGPQVLGHFGFLHALSLFTLYAVHTAWQAARRHDVRTHQRFMLGTYCFGVLVAGGFALAPGRMLHAMLFG